MPYKIECECPRCGKKADGLREIELLFGWREIDSKKIPQSHCRRCRTQK